MSEPLNARTIAGFHDRMVNDMNSQSVSAAENLVGPWRWVGANHLYNILLWNEEDKARRTDVEPIEIATSKRLIDQYNQKRNDAVERLDEILIVELGCEAPSDTARFNSETPGAMTDRLSILSLKIFHMREQTLRDDASAQHVETCSIKLERLANQREDLGYCLDKLFEDARAGRAYFKIYRQFKMYNDSTLNPYLYGKRRQAETGKAMP